MLQNQVKNSEEFTVKTTKKQHEKKTIIFLIQFEFKYCDKLS